MKIDILTLFPDMFKNVLNESIIGRAINNKILEVNYVNIRDFSTNKHKKVDDYPFGGGPGMVMKCGPIYSAINSVKTNKSRTIYLTPKGKVYSQSLANELSRENHLVLLCGHYEGVDNRIIENYIDDEISIGDYVLTGGEIPAMIIVDSIARLIPGVLPKEESYRNESHYNGILEYPQYTRPQVFKGNKVPDVLLSGNHKKIEQWRKQKALEKTNSIRPDLIEKKEFSKDEKMILDKIIKETQ